MTKSSAQCVLQSSVGISRFISRHKRLWDDSVFNIKANRMYDFSDKAM